MPQTPQTPHAADAAHIAAGAAAAYFSGRAVQRSAGSLAACSSCGWLQVLAAAALPPCVRVFSSRLKASQESGVVPDEQ